MSIFQNKPEPSLRTTQKMMRLHRQILTVRLSVFSINTSMEETQCLGFIVLLCVTCGFSRIPVNTELSASV